MQDAISDFEGYRRPRRHNDCELLRPDSTDKGIGALWIRRQRKAVRPKQVLRCTTAIADSATSNGPRSNARSRRPATTKAKPRVSWASRDQRCCENSKAIAWKTTWRACTNRRTPRRISTNGVVPTLKIVNTQVTDSRAAVETRSAAMRHSRAHNRSLE